ncbi:glutamate ABC transporter substrate-binding protein [Corynebacterium sp. CCM 9185]|uniref:Glutamate ABC transporter substrate-binding protein n=1 Tax=Corynebacterium marambiense TaxID=2765364 RepID=A0ABS0VY79_9CORY|nr:glutamate ABC transporter substrate-binding protein [Corynebacterium marambiense]MBI9001341.1 glutamate ABC transporter substrate-binding protein [Corynebacterium marambiense]MCK7663896.1 glutamate ABC transporter substrate-binding protein [Corynebacterium marambiense]
MRYRHRLATAVLVAAAVTVASCARPDHDESQPAWVSTTGSSLPLPPGAVVEKAGSNPGKPILVDGLLGSRRPGNENVEDRVPAILARGRLIVGVDQSQNLLSFRDSTTGELEGFEVDLAREIARDIFGDPSKVDFRFVDSADRVLALEAGTVDIVVRSLTITRSRQDQIAFSTPYFTARTRILAMESSNISSLADLEGRTVCVTNGSTAAERARSLAPEADLLLVRNWADCLVAVQQYQADAVISDDAILSGIAEQDPYTRLVGPALGEAHYGVGIASPGYRHDTDGLIRQVNATIERVRQDGTWWMLYNRWLGPYQSTAGPPPLDYRPEPERDMQQKDEG